MKNIILAIAFMTSAFIALADKTASQGYVNAATNKVFQDAKTYTDAAIENQDGKHYAMFILPMNDGSHASGNYYSQFELKASTNNFQAIADTNKFCFYCKSFDASTGEVGVKDRVYLYVQDTSAGENRRYVRIINTRTIDYQPAEYIVVVDTALMLRSSDHSWFSNGNDNLTWQFLKANATSYEKDSKTGNPLWHPVQPVKWFSKLPDWIN